jgi:hypothetical protein
MEAALEEVTVAVMRAVEPLGVFAVEPLHAARQSGLGSVEDEVVVVATRLHVFIQSMFDPAGSTRRMWRQCRGLGM